MKGFLTSILVFFVVNFQSAQTAQREYYISDSILSKVPLGRTERGYLQIEQNWKYHNADISILGDDWKSPDFNDDGWEFVNAGLYKDTFPKDGWNGEGVFRLHVRIDSNLLNKALVINIFHLGASEVYLDGKLLFNCGVLGKSPNAEEGFNALTKIPNTVIFTKQQHVIAVRYSGKYLLENSSAVFQKFGFTLAIGRPEVVNPILLNNAKFFRALESLVISVPLTFALIHLILFLFYRSQKSNLFFAVFAVTLALWGVLEHESVGNQNAQIVIFLKKLWAPYFAIMPLTGLGFLYSLFYKPVPRQFWYILFITLVASFFFWFGYFIWISVILFFGIIVEMIRVVVIAMRKNINGAWIIGIGFGMFCLSLVSIIILITSNHFSLSLWYILLYVTGVFPVLVSMSVYLSHQVAGTHRDLEVQILNNLKLEYENSKKEIELKKADELRLAFAALEDAHNELRSTQSQLIQSEKMASLGELTAGIAHEIQNPLNFVNNFSEINKELLTEMNTEIERQNYEEVKSIAKDVIENEEKIQHHGKRADAIVKGMLQHSRSSNGIKEPTDINALVDEYLRLAYHGLRAKDKSFNSAMKTYFDDDIGKINIIPQDIGRVILNLFTNAFYAVDQRRKANTKEFEPLVTVTTKKHLNQVSIAVWDNGNGIPPKILDKIFQPFFTTKPTGQGTGLGLSLSYDIVKAHGGELKVETREGEFTEFIIILPTV
jgi:two-component system NtrC family sensor kinase